MSQTDLVLERLQSGALDALIEICLDDLFARPIQQLLPAELVAQRIVQALRDAAEAPQLEAQLGQQLATLREQAIEPDASGRAFAPGHTLRRHLPAELTDPIEELLAEPWLPERDLVLRLLDHEAMRSLIQEVLHASLVRFARKMRSFKPDTSKLKAGLGRRVPTGLSRLKDIGSGVVSVVGSELESQLDARVGEFVSQAISAVLGHVATLLTAPERAETMGDWRAYGFRVVLDTELEAFAAEARKLDPDRVVAATLHAVRALAARDSLEAELTELVSDVMAPWAQRSLGEQLGTLGLEQTWRTTASTWLREQLEPVLQTTAFRAWLQALLGTTDKI
jgi:hypothetical protein